ncbi:MAG: hypothetical protein AAFQ67_09405, partial [Pseudomonadota bacterium]
DLNGVLTRATPQDGELVLRLSPFVFKGDLNSKPILEIKVKEPKFDSNELEKYIRSEVFVQIERNILVISDWDFGDELVIESEDVETNWSPYSREELHDWVIGLLSSLEQERNENLDARRIISGLRSFLLELRRRSLIKSEASAELGRLQSANLATIQKLLTKIGDFR